MTEQDWQELRIGYCDFNGRGIKETPFMQDLIFIGSESYEWSNPDNDMGFVEGEIYLYGFPGASDCDHDEIFTNIELRGFVITINHMDIWLIESFWKANKIIRMIQDAIKAEKGYHQVHMKMRGLSK
jgi:hypothetical protein